MDDPSWKLDEHSLKPLPPPHHAVMEAELDYLDYSLAISGDVFRWMINHAPLHALQNVRPTFSTLTPKAYSCV